MDYIGSKEKLNDWIFSILKNYSITEGWFLDACAGSGSTSRFASSHGWKIISNDLFSFSSCVVKGSCNFNWDQYALEIASHILKINKLDGKEGFFYENYSKMSQSGRLFFTAENAARIDAARSYVEENCSQNKQIYNYVLWRLLEGVSSVLNTTGVQAAYLKNIKTRAAKKMSLGLSKDVHYNINVKCFNEDIVSLLKKNRLKESVIYIDPPYNSRQYGPNYHLYETLIKYDNPNIYGKAGLRDWKNESKSNFCSKKTFASVLKDIIEYTSAKILMLSYNTDGLLNENEIMEILKSCARCKNGDVFKREQRRYKADKENSGRKYNESKLYELLFVINLE